RDAAGGARGPLVAEHAGIDDSASGAAGDGGGGAGGVAHCQRSRTVLGLPPQCWRAVALAGVVCCRAVAVGRRVGAFATVAADARRGPPDQPRAGGLKRASFLRGPIPPTVNWSYAV